MKAIKKQFTYKEPMGGVAFRRVVNNDGFGKREDLFVRKVR